MLRQYAMHPGLTAPQDGGTGTKTEKRRKTEFQTCNLSNPQSCENDWGEKGGDRRGEMVGQGVRKRANFQTNLAKVIK